MTPFWKKFTLYCGIGEMLGLILAAAIGYFTLIGIKAPPGWSVQLEVLGLMALAGIFEGSLLGYFQWKALAGKLPELPAFKWIAATALLTILGWTFCTLGFLMYYPEGPVIPFIFSEFSLFDHPFLFLLEGVVAGVFAGLGIGLFQWVVLRRHLEKAGRWIWANILGWGLGLNFILVATYLPFSGLHLWAILLMGAAGGLLAGLTAGLVISLIMREKM